MSIGRVLVVDADESTRSSLCDFIRDCGYDPTAEADAVSALERTDEFQPAVIIAEVASPLLEGFSFLREIRSKHPDIAVILLTGDGSVESALMAIQEEGAYHYFEKPVDVEKFRVVLRKAVEISQARGENELRRRQMRDCGSFGDLVGRSDSMRQIYSLIEQVSPSSVSVLLTGESGTGKEVVARTIHNLSPRKVGPFIAINCSAIPETLMESELFGHEKGAFTGADAGRRGCFELAEGGTLLLDEVAEMPISLQVKLLRVLEERSLRRLGGTREIQVDVRLLAATNKDPYKAVRDNHLREDLLYRLNVITLHMPPLRERKDDLPLLARHMVTLLSHKHSRPARFLSRSAIDILSSHNWPGNVRELRNVIERAVIICSGDTIERHHFAPYPVDQRSRARIEDTLSLPVGTPIEEVERQMILRTLQKTLNNKTRAAELLGISLKTLHNKLKLYRDRGVGFGADIDPADDHPGS